MSKKHPLKVLDVVRTGFGTLAVVSEVTSYGDVSLVLPLNSTQKIAWYDPKELILVGSLKDICAQVTDQYIGGCLIDQKSL
jgi:hypothetical protein